MLLVPQENFKSQGVPAALVGVWQAWRWPDSSWGRGMQVRAGVLGILVDSKTAWPPAFPPMDTEPWPRSLGSGLPHPRSARTGHPGAEGMKGASVGHMSSLAGLRPRDSRTLGPHPDLLHALHHPPPDNSPLPWPGFTFPLPGVACLVGTSSENWLCDLREVPIYFEEFPRPSPSLYK